MSREEIATISENTGVALESIRSAHQEECGFIWFERDENVKINRRKRNHVRKPIARIPYHIYSKQFKSTQDNNHMKNDNDNCNINISQNIDINMGKNMENKSNGNWKNRAILSELSTQEWKLRSFLTHDNSENDNQNKNSSNYSNINSNRNRNNHNQVVNIENKQLTFSQEREKRGIQAEIQAGIQARHKHKRRHSVAVTVCKDNSICSTESKETINNDGNDENNKKQNNKKGVKKRKHIRRRILKKVSSKKKSDKNGTTKTATTTKTQNGEHSKWKRKEKSRSKSKQKQKRKGKGKNKKKREIYRVVKQPSAINIPDFPQLDDKFLKNFLVCKNVNISQKERISMEMIEKFWLMLADCINNPVCNVFGPIESESPLKFVTNICNHFTLLFKRKYLYDYLSNAQVNIVTLPPVNRNKKDEKELNLMLTQANPQPKQKQKENIDNKIVDLGKEKEIEIEIEKKQEKQKEQEKVKMSGIGMYLKENKISGEILLQFKEFKELANYNMLMTKEIEYNDKICNEAFSDLSVEKIFGLNGIEDEDNDNDDNNILEQVKDKQFIDTLENNLNTTCFDLKYNVCEALFFVVFVSEMNCCSCMCFCL